MIDEWKVLEAESGEPVTAKDMEEHNERMKTVMASQSQSYSSERAGKVRPEW